MPERSTSTSFKRAGTPSVHPYDLTWSVRVLTVFPSHPRGENGEWSWSRRGSTGSPHRPWDRWCGCPRHREPTPRRPRVPSTMSSLTHPEASVQIASSPIHCSDQARAVRGSGCTPSNTSAARTQRRSDSPGSWTRLSCSTVRSSHIPSRVVTSSQRTAGDRARDLRDACVPAQPERRTRHGAVVRWRGGGPDAPGCGRDPRWYRGVDTGADGSHATATGRPPLR